MNYLKLYLFIITPFIMVAHNADAGQQQPNRENLKLWYNQPADASAVDNRDGWKSDTEWLKALPLGNGSLGLMVFGDVNKERIQLNEESMWSGSPNDSDNPDAYAAQAKIRQLLFAGKYKEATELTNKTQVASGKGSGYGNGANVPFGSFQTLGDLWIDNGKQEPYENYYRELDLEDAVVRVSYTQNEVNYKREIFTSYPDQVMAAHFSADQPGEISFTITMTRPERYQTYVEDDQLIMSGSLSDGKGGEGLEYMARLKAVAKNGEISYEDSKIIIKNADEVTLYLSASTDYVLQYPHYTGREYKKITNQNIEEAVEKGYNTILKNHKKDYQQYFQRVGFDITPEKVIPISTQKRVEEYSKENPDLHLEELMFQFGRYLLISSSRPGTLPANLQGIWSNKIQTPWNGDYHTDINVQMNYWPAEIANLSELHLPLFDLMESLVEPGKKTAAIQYHNKGWVVHPITNVWGYTSPGESASWGMHTGAGAWLSSHIREHYSFTDDKVFLERMYPVLEGSIKFYMDWLVEHPETGKLVSGPAVSPENTFIAPDGSHSQISMGPAHDQQVIGQLFSDFIYVSGELDINNDFIEKIKVAKKNLAGSQIASDGRLMEWDQDFEEVEPGHRHFSHLFALYPGHQINMEETPKLARAAKESLDYRLENGGGHTAWSAAWLINLYARLHEGERAYDFLNLILSRNTAPNLFTTIDPVADLPPFQIDANFGLTAGIVEMLLQSHAGNIEFLPALPEEWPTGKVSGLRARGGFTIDMEWKNGQLLFADVHASKDQDVKLKYGDKEKTVSLKKGEVFRFLIDSTTKDQ